MTQTKTEPKEKEKKVKMVPRKKLQSVPDLLMNGDNEASATESTASKALWMTFLVIMFYVSLEIFLRLKRAQDAAVGSEVKSEL